eukprot:10948079-Ditylum_brightwellii.AAC.1
MTEQPRRRHQRHQGTLLPDSLLSTIQLEEEVMSPEVSATGWVRRRLTLEAIADAFDPSTYVSSVLGSMQENVKFISNSTPGKVLAIVLMVFNNSDLEEDKLPLHQSQEILNLANKVYVKEEEKYLKAVKADDTK